MAEAEPSLNIPSLLTLAVFSFFVIRWFFGRNGEIPSNDAGQRRGGGRRVDPAHVEQISQMFPQLDRRDIMWDLQRNGGSMAATTERVLSGRGLETPPPSFQPQIPLPSTPATPAGASSRSTPKPPAQDLISRYNLTDRINSEPPQTEASAGSGTIIHQESAWSQNKSERQRLLQKRRDEMILAARRKLQEKDKVSGQ
ncbi:hypothetical protein AJ79_03976 [Helicocarpus griseus UAMH5409]|uniref:Coupling of ubiquitin conjugation to ER degradation protein 1 n=1 Tax=Helicocarpus griseus UAMH5409 TaxID=1447875 RepID=A0A2B7XUI7_9EURO|nr:hypothetical protein AJ79_03976 [Helicocarpus griseus UAMH5409]